ncbi:hypothetical protein NKI79_21335 [Mesorhizobium sp. M0340]|uniref:hypothetical protein n=1 Tax=Mesorhizobium sp. M0340 TaxID=2956939 RepID=UPI00333B0A6D
MGKLPFRFQTQLEEALSEAMHAKAPPANPGLIDAPWIEEMRPKHVRSTFA